MRDGYDNSPLNPVPAVVWILVLPVIAVEIVVNLGLLGLAGGQAGSGWRNAALQQFALSPAMLDQMIQTNTWWFADLKRFVTYAFVHGSTTHTIFAVVFILAIGKFVAEVMKPWAVIAVFLGAAVAGAVAYSLVPGIRAALFGAFPAIYGLIGAFTFILWARLGAVHANRARAFTLIGFLLAIQLLFGVIFGGTWDWVADIAGFAAGFLLSFVVGPGGPAHLLRAIRQR